MERVEKYKEAADQDEIEIKNKITKLMFNYSDLSNQQQRIVSEKAIEIKKILRELLDELKEQNTKAADFIKINGTKEDYLRIPSLNRPIDEPRDHYRRSPPPPPREHHHHHHERRFVSRPPMRKSPPNFPNNQRPHSNHGKDDDGIALF